MITQKLSVGQLRSTWQSLSAKPGGKWLFSRLFGKLIPYSGSVTPEVLELAPGRAVIAMADRRAVRNHLNCVHAIALANLGEMSTGLALGFGMPSDARSILVRLSCEYRKKARGRLVATCDAPAVTSDRTCDYEVESFVRDSAGDLVAKATVVWRVGPAD
jgi:acyl-coenzyme A thioesterase PaaI-like protein